MCFLNIHILQKDLFSQVMVAEVGDEPAVEGLLRLVAIDVVEGEQFVVEGRIQEGEVKYYKGS